MQRIQIPAALEYNCGARQGSPLSRLRTARPGLTDIAGTHPTESVCSGRNYMAFCTSCSAGKRLPLYRCTARVMVCIPERMRRGRTMQKPPYLGRRTT
jgi:hypothetical protein